MKKLIVTLAIMFAAMLPAMAASPQDGARDELAQKQALRFADELGLDDATAEKFVKLYVQNQRDNWALQTKDSTKNRKEPKTDAQIDSSIRAQFDYSQKVLDVRKKYYKEYRKLLTAKQVKRLYDRERFMNTKIRGASQAQDRRKAAKVKSDARKEAAKARSDARKKTAEARKKAAKAREKAAEARAKANKKADDAKKEASKI